MEHLLPIFHISKYAVFQRCQKVLFWSKGLKGSFHLFNYKKTHLAFVYSNYIPMFCSLLSRVKVIIFSGKKHGACMHVNLIILQFIEKTKCGYSQELPQRGNSSMFPHYLF